MPETRAVPQTAAATRGRTLVVTASVAPGMEQANGLVPEVSEAVTQGRIGGAVKLGHGLGEIGLVVLRVVAIRNRGCIIRAAGRVVVGGNLTGNRVVKTPAISSDRSRGHSKDGGHCKGDRHTSPFSETHGLSLTYSSMKSSWSVRNQASDAAEVPVLSCANDTNCPG